MKKTLFIQIDNTPAPIEAENDYIPLDCRQINDFCSFVGDALVGDLKDENGKPFYRLVNPVGRLLSEYEKVDKANYDLIIAQWLDLLGEILHKGATQCDEQFAISFPQQYVDWLLCNENDYYVQIGKHLQSNDSKVYLEADGISKDIISALHMKIHRFLENKNEEIEYIVFSNERISNSSYIVKKLKNLFYTYTFIRLEQWNRIIQEELDRVRKSLDDYRAFWFDGLKLGITTENDFSYYSGDIRFEDLEFKRDGKLSRIEINNVYSLRTLNEIVSILYGEIVDSKKMSYCDMSSFLVSKKGFTVTMKSLDNRGFASELIKDTDTYLCRLHFVSDYFKEVINKKEGTLFRIIIELK